MPESGAPPLLPGRQEAAPLLARIARRIAGARTGADSSCGLDARLLLGMALGREGAVFPHETVSLAEGDLARLEGLVARRAAGEPVSRLRGWREFYSLRFAITPPLLTRAPTAKSLSMPPRPGCRRGLGAGRPGCSTSAPEAAASSCPSCANARKRQGSGSISAGRRSNAQGATPKGWGLPAGRSSAARIGAAASAAGSMPCSATPPTYPKAISRGLAGRSATTIRKPLLRADRTDCRPGARRCRRWPGGSGPEAAASSRSAGGRRSRWRRSRRPPGCPGTACCPTFRGPGAAWS